MAKLIQPDTYHPLHPGVSCPKCGKHTVMKVENEDRYVCLNCSWQRDIANDAWGSFSSFWSLVITILIVLLML